MLFNASNEMPFVNAASPKMQTTFFIRAAFVSCRSHAERGGKCCSSVTRSEAIVFALRAQCEAIQTIRLTDRVKAVASACQDFVDINLMTHVPNEFVFGCAEDVVQSDG